MRSITGKPLKDMIKNNASLYMICCIPVFPFCLSLNILLYAYMEYNWDMGGFGNCMLLITGVSFLVCLAAFRYSLKAYLRQEWEKYSLLVMLGISSRDFWKTLAKEYCPAFIILLAASAFCSNIISNLLLAAIFRGFSRDVILASTKLLLVLILLFLTGMAGTLLILKWKQWRRNLGGYIEKMGSKSEKLHRFRIAYGMKIFLAIFCFLFSFILMYDYSVGKLFLAVGFHMLGIYFLLQLNERLVKKVFCINQKHYYQKLLLWNDFIYGFRMNGNLIYCIYAANFLLVLVFGGILVSEWPEDSFYSEVKIIAAVVGLAIILEGQMILLERMLLDTRNAKKQHDILFQLGIEKKAYVKLIQNKIGYMTVFPGIMATVTGVYFFMCDYIYQEDVTALSELVSLVLLKYAGTILMFWMVQYCGYFFIQKRVREQYARFETAAAMGRED